MRVKEVMSDHMDCLGPKSTLKDVATEMLNHDFGFLPLKANKKLVGVVTDRDLAIKALAKGLAADAKVEQIMTKDILCCHDYDDIKHAAKLMENNKIRRLVVLNNNEEPTGVISLGDIVTECNDHNISAEIIEAVSIKY